jgi:hypothetical protein
MRTLAAAFLLLLAPGTEDATPVDFSALSGFEYEEGMELPESVRKLNGKKIRIVGFIRTEDGRTDDIDVFWLVDQNCDCEGMPKMNEIILCTMPEGRTISNDDSLIEVTGYLEAGEEREDGYVMSIYRMQVESVK